MYDIEAQEIIELVLIFFPFDNSIQLVDVKRGKSMLRRVQLPTLKESMLQVGNIVNIFSKFILITDSAPATKKTLFYNVNRYE